MLTNNTIEGLHSLRLPGMVKGLLEQRDHPDYDALGFEERLGMLVDRELTERSNRRLQRMLKTAHLRLSATVEAIEYDRPRRGLDRSTILSLAESHWVANHHCVIVVGATGLGKTFIGCALANAAVRRGHSALYLRGPRLHDEITLARADGRLPRLLASWARTDVLLIDDFLLRPLSPDQAADILEVIEDRIGLRSTIVTSQLPVGLWHQAMGEPTVADGILDRLLENVHRIELSGESLRRSRTTDPDPRPNRRRMTNSDTQPDKEVTAKG